MIQLDEGAVLTGAISLNPGSSLAPAGAGSLASDVDLAGGSLKVSDARILPGTLSLSASSSIEVTDNLTLPQSAGLGLGPYTLSLSGGGTLGVPGELKLDDELSELVLSGIILDRGSTASVSKGIRVDSSSAVVSLSVGHETVLEVAEGTELSGHVELGSSGALQLMGPGEVGSTLDLSGGRLEIAESMLWSGQWSQTADGTLEIAQEKVLSYGGGVHELGIHTLEIKGFGELELTAPEAALVLNVPGSRLALSGSGMIPRVLVQASPSDGRGLRITGQPTLAGLEFQVDSSLSVTEQFSVAEGIVVRGVSLTLEDSGTFASGLVLSLIHISEPTRLGMIS